MCLQECLKFIKDVRIGSEDVSANGFHLPGALFNVYSEACPTILKVLPCHLNIRSLPTLSSSLPLRNLLKIVLQALQSHADVVSSPHLSEEMERLDADHLRANSRIQNGGVSELTSSDSYADDVEAEANSYFHQMFSGELAIDVMIQMLTRFKESSENRYPFNLNFVSPCVS